MKKHYYFYNLLLVTFLSTSSLLIAQEDGKCYRIHNQGDGATYFLSADTDSTSALFNDPDNVNGVAAGDSTIWKLHSGDAENFKIESAVFPGKYLTMLERADTAGGHRVLIIEDEIDVLWTFVEKDGNLNIVPELEGQFLHGGQPYDEVRAVRGAIYAGPRSQWLLIDAECPAEPSSIKTLAQKTIVSSSYPNPASSNVTIAYTLEKGSNASIEIINIAGQKVATLVNTYKASGQHTVNLDATELSAGTYIYKIMSDEGIAINEIILVK